MYTLYFSFYKFRSVVFHFRSHNSIINRNWHFFLRSNEGCIHAAECLGNHLGPKHVIEISKIRVYWNHVAITCRKGFRSQVLFSQLWKFCILYITCNLVSFTQFLSAVCVTKRTNFKLTHVVQEHLLEQIAQVLAHTNRSR